MSFDFFKTLENKIKKILEIINILQMEVNELKNKNYQLKQEIIQIQEKQKKLTKENQNLKEIKFIWQQHIRNILHRINDI